jgi:hypothetical protein
MTRWWDDTYQDAIKMMPCLGMMAWILPCWFVHGSRGCLVDVYVAYCDCVHILCSFFYQWITALEIEDEDKAFGHWLMTTVFCAG